jgi:hypothetical protein
MLLSAIATSPITAQQGPPLRPAVPLEPIGAILDAFRSHSIVALGEDHGNEQGHAVRLSLIRDSRFAANVNDIVVEFGNARYQDLMDGFVRGGNVSEETLRHVWQDTTQISGVWDRPIYEDFFRAVRAVNASLPRERQLRVLLGDLPVDWDAARRMPPKPGEAPAVWSACAQLHGGGHEQGPLRGGSRPTGGARKAAAGTGDLR